MKFSENVRKGHLKRHAKTAPLRAAIFFCYLRVTGMGQISVKWGWGQISVSPEGSKVDGGAYLELEGRKGDLTLRYSRYCVRS